MGIQTPIMPPVLDPNKTYHCYCRVWYSKFFEDKYCEEAEHIGYQWIDLIGADILYNGAGCIILSSITSCNIVAIKET